MSAVRWPEGVRRTRPRERLLTILEQAEQPLTLSQLRDRLARSSASPVWTSTLYRTLDLLEQHGMVNRQPVPDGGPPLYELNRHGSRHYAFCLGCRKVIPVERCPVYPDTAALAERDFTVTGHRLELFGYCRDCRVPVAVAESVSDTTDRGGSGSSD